jgi:DNA-binding HxlR family transcriptional regulator
VRVKTLEEIKHADKVMGALSTGELFFNDLHSKTFLDAKTLQVTLNRLKKNGYVVRTQSKKWAVVG